MANTSADLRVALSSHAPVRMSVGRRAAVLIPIYFAPEGARVLFMKRPHGTGAHSGQVSFPGGRAEPQDTDEAQTALREAHEEVGITSDIVEVVGTLDDFGTAVTDFRVTPVVGVLQREPTLVPAPAEVADVFWVPLHELAQTNAWRSERFGPHNVWFFDNAPHVIWGATAAMLRQFLEWTCDMR